MDQITKLKDAVFGYFSPPPAKRRRTMGPATPSNALTSEKVVYAVESEPQGAEAKAARIAKLKQKHASPSLGKLGQRKRVRDVFEHHDEVTEEEEDSIDPRDSSSQVTPLEDSTTSPDVDDDQGAGFGDGPGMSASDRVQELFLAEREEIQAKRQADIHDFEAQGGWHKDESYVYQKITMRGLEDHPLLPPSWHMDFPTVPAETFAASDEDAFFNAASAEDSHACRKLKQLINTVKHVSSMKSFHGRPFENIMSVGIKNYIKWSEVDGGYHHLGHIPVIVSMKANHRNVPRMEKMIIDRMVHVAKLHRDHLIISSSGNADGGKVKFRREPPVIYGILNTRKDMVFFTVNSASAEAEPRHLVHFRLDDPKLGFWNGIAIAIMILMARDYQISVKDEFELPKEE